MKVALIFYSYSGNTKKAVVYLKDKLIYNNIEVEMIEIKLVNEERNFFKQCLAAFRKKTPCICESLKYDLGAFDLAIFSTAVWAFKITPALRSYLNKVKGLENKEVGCFLTYGSGTGAKSALTELEDILTGKGAKLIFSQGLTGHKTKHKSYLEERFEHFLQKDIALSTK